jgi:hypothetical protein
MCGDCVFCAWVVVATNHKVVLVACKLVVIFFDLRRIESDDVVLFLLRFFLFDEASRLLSVIILRQSVRGLHSSSFSKHAFYFFTLFFSFLHLLPQVKVPSTGITYRVACVPFWAFLFIYWGLD